MKYTSNRRMKEIFKRIQSYPSMRYAIFTACNIGPGEARTVNILLFNVALRNMFKKMETMKKHQINDTIF